MLQLDLEQGSDEWLESRMLSFNASECGSLFGCSPYDPQTPLKLAEIKYAGRTIFVNDAMRRGNEQEPFIREHIEQKYEINLYPIVGCLEEDNRFRASFDGITEDGNTICEIKNSDKTYLYTQKHLKPPKNYELQIQHQLLVSGANVCIFAVRNNTSGEIIDVMVYPDNEIQEEIKLRWIEFEEFFKDVEWEVA